MSALLCRLARRTKKEKVNRFSGHDEKTHAPKMGNQAKLGNQPHMGNRNQPCQKVSFEQLSLSFWSKLHPRLRCRRQLEPPASPQERPAEPRRMTWTAPAGCFRPAWGKSACPGLKHVETNKGVCLFWGTQNCGFASKPSKQG